MKTTRRHELQTNQLADALAHSIEKVQPYSRAIVAALVAAVVLIFAWGYLTAENSRKVTDGWNEYFDAFTSRNPREALSDVADRYVGTPVSDWARLVLADMQLDDGTNRLFVDKKNARDELKQAVEKYRAVLAEAHEAMLLERATYGLARAHEALGTLNEARDEYRSLAEKWHDSPYAGPSLARAKDLDRQNTKVFYDWFAKYEPPRPMANEPGTPGLRPDFLKDSLLDSPLKFPATSEDNAPLPRFPDETNTTPAANATFGETPLMPVESRPISEPSNSVDPTGPVERSSGPAERSSQSE